MATGVKLRRVSEATNAIKAVAPELIELLDKNFWDIETGLSSVGAVTGSPGGGSGGGIPGSTISHHSLLDLTTFDDHSQYLFLPGRPSTQEITTLGNSSSAIAIALRNSNNTQVFKLFQQGTVALLDDNNYVAPGGFPLLLDVRVKNRAWGGTIAQFAVGTSLTANDIVGLKITADGIMAGMKQTDNYKPTFYVRRDTSYLSGGTVTDSALFRSTAIDIPVISFMGFSAGQTAPLTQWVAFSSGETRTPLSYIQASDGAFVGPIVATNGILSSTPAFPALRLRDGVGASTDMLQIQDSDGTNTFFRWNQDGSLMTWSSGVFDRLSMRISNSQMEFLDQSLRNLLTFNIQNTGTGWQGGDSTGILKLFDTNPDGKRVVIQSGGGVITRLGIAATRMVLDNDTSVTLAIPGSMFDIVNASVAGDILQRYIPHSLQSVDIWQSYDPLNTKTVWIDKDGCMNFDNRSSIANAYGVAQRYHTNSADTAVWGEILDVSNGLSLILLVDGALSGQNLIFPAAGGTVVTTTAAQTLDSKTFSTVGNVLRASTASGGVSFADNTTPTKRLRFILSTAVGNNVIRINSTVARIYDLPDASITLAGINLAQSWSALQTFGAGIDLSTQNIVTDGTTGTKIGTSTTQKLGLWNATPIVQPTNAIAAATFIANTSGIVDDSATWDGYTIGQVVKALRNLGVLA